MKIVFDVEANGLKPTEIFVIVCKEVGTCHTWVFREVTKDVSERERFLSFAQTVTTWIGHNILGYDFPVLYRLLDLPVIEVSNCLDTYILSKLIDYPRDGHSLEDYASEFGLDKSKFVDFSKYSAELEERCIKDVHINERVYLKYLKYIQESLKEPFQRGITLEHKVQLIVNNLETKGFTLDIPLATKVLKSVLSELKSLDEDILTAFPPRLRMIREVTPKETKYGTISKSSIPKDMRDSIADLSVGASFSYCRWVSFNPGSPKQVVTVLNEAGWQPEEKTKGHIETERTINQLKRSRTRSNELDITLSNAIINLDRLRIYGWKVNEKNLSTLPASANNAARTLARRILFESRRKTLTEWLGLVDPVTSRVHGRFQGIGAWTHRMSHQKPNMANITNAVRVSDGKTSLLGKELRQCWRAPKGRLLLGVDAEAIQLRVFAHLINDPKLIDAIVNGNKKEGTDPHSLNKAYFGSYCKTRNAAKHSLYAMFFGGTSSKISEIMDCSKSEAQQAIDALIEKYPGLAKLQKEVFPEDARRGYFIGLDGRKVRIPGETKRDREHLCMSGYLQNGEKVIMMTATGIFEPELKHYDSFLVDIIHDEWQNECPNNIDTCLAVAELECQSLVRAGEELDLKCPMAGSYRNDHGEYTIGTNWYQTH